MYNAGDKMKHKNFFFIVCVFTSVSSIYPMCRAAKRYSKPSRVCVQKRMHQSVLRKINLIYDDIAGLGSKECSDACSMTHVVNNCSLDGCSRGSYPYSKSMAAAHHAIKVKQIYLDTIDSCNTGDITENRIARLQEIKLEYEGLRALTREAIQALQTQGQEEHWLLYKQLFMLVHHKAECLSDQVEIIKEHTPHSSEITSIVISLNKQHKAEEASLKERFPGFSLLSCLMLPGVGHVVPYYLQQQGKEYFQVKE